MSEPEGCRLTELEVSVDWNRLATVSKLLFSASSRVVESICIWLALSSEMPSAPSEVLLISAVTALSTCRLASRREESPNRTALAEAAPLLSVASFSDTKLSQLL